MGEIYSADKFEGICNELVVPNKLYIYKCSLDEFGYVGPEDAYGKLL